MGKQISDCLAFPYRVLSPCGADTEPRALCMLSKYSVTELHFQPFFILKQGLAKLAKLTLSLLCSMGHS